MQNVAYTVSSNGVGCSWAAETLLLKFHDLSVTLNLIIVAALAGKWLLVDMSLMKNASEYYYLGTDCNFCYSLRLTSQ